MCVYNYRGGSRVMWTCFSRAQIGPKFGLVFKTNIM